MVSPYVDVELAETAVSEYRKRFPDKGPMTIGDEILVMCTLEALARRGQIVIDRGRFDRLIKAASSWASELEYPGDEPGGAIKWAGLEPGDLDPIP